MTKAFKKTLCNFFKYNSYFNSSKEPLKNSFLQHIWADHNIKLNTQQVMILSFSNLNKEENELESLLKKSRDFLCANHNVLYCLTQLWDLASFISKNIYKYTYTNKA